MHKLLTGTKFVARTDEKNASFLSENNSICIILPSGTKPEMKTTTIIPWNNEKENG